jgi:hypothetical protein
MEFTPKKIPVDPMDPKDIAKKLPALEREAARAEAFATEVAAFAAAARKMINHLHATAEVSTKKTDGSKKIDAPFVPAAPQQRANGKDAKRGSSREAILQLLEDEGRPLALWVMRDALQHQYAYDTLRGMVKDMTKDGDLIRVSQGVYAPAAWGKQTTSLVQLAIEQGE